MCTRTQRGSRRGSQAPTDLGGPPLSLYPCRQEGKHKGPWVTQLLWWQIQQSCCHSYRAMNSGVKLKSFGRDEGFTKQQRLNRPPSWKLQWRHADNQTIYHIGESQSLFVFLQSQSDTDHVAVVSCCLRGINLSLLPSILSPELPERLTCQPEQTLWTNRQSCSQDLTLGHVYTLKLREQAKGHSLFFPMNVTRCKWMGEGT